VALFQGPAVEALPALMDRADRALYASKRGGKGLATLADAPGGAAAQPG
jgi:predicted signal transduction protein with EAL and GGDEF domain